MNGKGKSIKINPCDLAGIKQMPYLVRGIRKIMPELCINLGYRKLGYVHSKQKEIFKKDLAYNGIEERGINYKKTLFSESNITLDLEYNNYNIYESRVCDGGNTFRLPIDPLKFEKRRLLDENEIGNLKEKYKIKENEKVVLGGSLSPIDLSYLKRPLSNFLKKSENSKIILVPRYSGLSSINKELVSEGFDFEVDSEKIKGDKKVLLIEKLGFLDRLYSIADIVLIGGTFHFGIRWINGQNPLEPAFYGKKIISGSKYIDWNKVAYDGLKKSGLLKLVFSEKELEEELLRDFSEEELEESRKEAQSFIKSQQGAGEVYARIVQKKLYKDFSSADEKFLSYPRSFEELKGRYGKN